MGFTRISDLTVKEDRIIILSDKLPSNLCHESNTPHFRSVSGDKLLEMLGEYEKSL